MAVRMKALEYRPKWRGRRFLGVDKLKRQDTDKASREDRFTITLQVAASSNWLRIAQLQLNR